MEDDPPVVLGLKIDVDTLVGYQRGVPALLSELQEARAWATFFISVGPDRSGLAVRRVFTQRGFLGKMLRTRALSTYGLRTALYGTLLRAPLIVDSDPGIVRDISRAGHEVGVHGWDHIAWHDGVGRMRESRVRDDLGRAFDRLEEILGSRPASFAAPGWQCCEQSLVHHDAAGLLYASDVRGPAVTCRPRLGGRIYATPQIPTSLPTLDEMWGRTARTAEAAVQEWLRMLRPGFNVLTAHAEMEGLAMPGALLRLIRETRNRGGRVQPLARIAEAAGQDLPAKDVTCGRLPGRAGKVSCVGD